MMLCSWSLLDRRTVASARDQEPQQRLDADFRVLPNRLKTEPVQRLQPRSRDARRQFLREVQRRDHVLGHLPRRVRAGTCRRPTPRLSEVMM